jgi:dihydrofolate synthase / folylpolyglutamate synthase
MLGARTPESDRAAQATILARLQRLHPRVIDLSLGRVQRLLAALGRPERKLPPVVHVAGTNGKGSLLAYMRAALEASGRRVHVYTSPHLVRFNERIRLAGEVISPALLCQVLEETERANAEQEITFFEVTTAAAFLAFAETPADILLLETGLGGRLDATNVIERPLLTAITPISYDHQQFLGHELGGIALEKAGILKSGVVGVLGPQPEAAAEVIAGRAAEIGAPLMKHGPDWQIAAEGAGLVYRSALAERRLPRPGLAGTFQIENAGLAVACLERLYGFRLDDDAIARGLIEVEWPARMQPLSSGPLVRLAPPGAQVWLDGGHNPGAGQVVAETLAGWPKRPLHMIFAMLDSKDPEGYLAPFRPLDPKLVTVPVPGSHASIAPERLVQVAEELGLEAEAATDPATAMARIAAESGRLAPPPRILICGSLYLAGEVLAENA